MSCVGFLIQTNQLFKKQVCNNWKTLYTALGICDTSSGEIVIF